MQNLKTVFSKKELKSKLVMDLNRIHKGCNSSGYNFETINIGFGNALWFTIEENGSCGSCAGTLKTLTIDAGIHPFLDPILYCDSCGCKNRLCVGDVVDKILENLIFEEDKPCLTFTNLALDIGCLITQEEFDSLKSQVECLQNDCDDYVDTITKQMETIFNLNQRVASLTRTNNQLNDSLMAEKRKVKKLQEENCELRRENCKLKEELAHYTPSYSDLTQRFFDLIP